MYTNVACNISTSESHFQLGTCGDTDISNDNHTSNYDDIDRLDNNGAEYPSLSALTLTDTANTDISHTADINISDTADTDNCVNRNELASVSQYEAIDLDELTSTSCMHVQEEALNDDSIPVQFEETLASIDHDIAVAVLKAFQLMEDMKGSQKNLLDIVNYGKELYCKGNSDLLSRWPTSWSACIGVLKKAGYMEPITYYVCLNPAHQCFWSITDKANDICKYCN